MTARLTRPALDAPVERRTDFVRELRAALDRLGVSPGEDFVVSSVDRGLYTVDDPAENHVGPGRRENSRKAALANYPSSGTQRWKVIVEVARAMPRGLTRDDLIARLGHPMNVIGPRVLEALEGGWLQESAEKALTRAENPATLLTLTQRGIDEIGSREGLTVEPTLFVAPMASARNQMFDPEA